jgi:PAS domain S-box-containing protein
MDSKPSESYDRLVRLAAKLIHAPVALVSLVDSERQFFKGCVGLPESLSKSRQTPIRQSFCKIVVDSEKPLIVNDTGTDPVLKDHPAHTELGVAAYAGFPIVTSDNQVLGSFCAIDWKPRVWTKEELETLQDITHSVITEIELALSLRETRIVAAESLLNEARTHAVITSALDCIISIDEQGTILEFNPAAEATFGYSAAAAIGKKMAELIVPPAFREAHYAGMARYQKTLKPHVIGKRIEIIGMRADGSEVPIELALSVLEFPVRIFTAFIRDITERKLAAEEINRSATMLQAIQKSQAQFIVDITGSTAFETLLSCLLAMTNSDSGFVAEVLHTSSGSPYLKARSLTGEIWTRCKSGIIRQSEALDIQFFDQNNLIGAALSSRAPVISNDPQNDPRAGELYPGYEKLQSLLAIPFMHGEEMVGMIGVANRPGGYSAALIEYLRPFLATAGNLISAQQDRERRKSAEETLRIERDFKTAIFDTATALVIVLDNSGTVVDFNSSCEEMTGYSRSEVIGKPIWTTPFYPREDVEASRKYWTERTANWPPANHERWWIARSGARRLTAWNTSVIRDENGKPAYYVRCGLDITEQRRNEQALIQARQREIEIGAQIQQTLLMTRPPEVIAGFRTGSIMQASQKIDGDYIEFFNCGNQLLHFDFLIGDVMGKGATAALLGAASKGQFQRAIRRLIIQTSEFNRAPEPVEILAAVQEVMAPELINLDSFITLNYARFHPGQRKLSLIDCGHTSTMHYHSRSNTWEFLQGKNLPLGVLEHESYIAMDVPIDLGDIILFYSDGVTEAVNTNGEFFGEEGLLRTVQSAAQMAPPDLAKHIYEEVCQFTGTTQMADDFTCVAFRFEQDNTHIAEHRIAREFPADMDSLEEIRTHVTEFCQREVGPLVEEAVQYMVLAVNEAVTNIVRHAYGGRPGNRLQIIIEALDDEVIFYLHDNGLPFDPTGAPQPDFDGGRDGGFGLFIIEQCMDAVYYNHYDLGKNCLSMSRKIKPEDRVGPDRRPAVYDI